MTKNSAQSSPRPPAGPGKGALTFLFLTVLIDLLGFGIVIPLLPVYSQAYGASEMELGLLFASFSLMQFLFAPLWGRLSDRIGRRPVLIGGLLGTALSYALFGLATDMRWLFVSRLLAGFFGANVSTAQAWIADVTSEQNRAKGMGLVGAAFGLGFTLGPLMGGELTRVSLAAPGLFAAALSAAAAALGFFTLKETVGAKRSPARLFGLEPLRRAAAQPRLATPYVLYFMAIFSFSAFEAMFTRFGLAVFPGLFGVETAIENASLEQIMGSAPYAGRYLAGIGVVSAVIQGGLIRRLVPRFGETRLAVWGPAILGLGLAVIAVGGRERSFALVIAGCLLMPLGFGLNNPALNALISRAAPAAEQGSFLGLNQSLASLARVTGPLVAGSVFVALGPWSPFALSALVLACAALVAQRYHRRYGASFERNA